MKKISIFLFAAAVLWGVGCDDSSDTDKVVPVSAIALDSSLSGGITMEVGQTTNIAGKVTVRPENATDKAETYESSDPETVSVDDAGVVKAVKPGLAMVTISVGGKHTHFEVKVEAKKIPVESISLPAELADGVTLKIGETLDIAGKATITPENATERTESYESSVPTTASVSEEGVVTAIAIGETTITVTVDGKSAHFTLTVEKVAVETVTLPDELTKGVTLKKGETLDITGKATVKPENATNRTESYDSSDKTVATVSAEGLVTALTVGTTTISVMVDGVSASFELTVAEDVPVDIETITITDGRWNNSLGTASVELKNGTATYDLYSRLVITPTNQNEGVAYQIVNKDGEFIDIDENGLITCKKVGTATVVVTAKNHKSLAQGNAKKVIFTLNITDSNDLDRTGWSMSASGPIKGTGGSATAALDEVFGTSSFPTASASIPASDATIFGLDRPGKNGAGDTIWFVVDMQQPRSVNYFRIMHQGVRNADRGCRWNGFTLIEGSNDNSEWTPIAENVELPDMSYKSQLDPNDGGTRNIDDYRTTSNVKFPSTVNYRYLRFVGKAANFTGNNGTCQIAELYLGLDE
ncbi:Ig-like domain-containing protein [Alistipes provencensis]|uniref:Ig-like domain-containing protein n=1 Tax=Alistipes provencensis TaxID=1816676 RepID=UPI0007ECA4DD|nr:Ig-like domain-containing protein [Alistipes provencensis]